MYTQGAGYWWKKHRVRIGRGPRILNILGFGPDPVPKFLFSRVRAGPGPKISIFSGPGPKKRVPAAPYRSC